MEKCPKCNRFTLGYDRYRGVLRCMVIGCSCVVIDENSYSYLKPDPSTKTMNRIKVERGNETKVIKKYSMV
ncbi:MAG: hypothetical protein ABSA46_15025 [Thermodesulfovibrionales bacterium]|jgi:phage FluMu protein Com